MGSADNRLRKKWQHYGGRNAANAENDFLDVFQKVFEDEGLNYEIIAKPKDFKNIYVGVELSSQVLSEIYTPPKPITRHSLEPDFAIKNTASGKTIFVEVKRQDGWVEEGVRADGRGNAHERSCKFFTPGLQKRLREKGGLGDEVLPFWAVFIGNITRDPCRVREVTCWYEGHEGHFFFWRDRSSPNALFDHFDKHIRPLLD